MSNDATLVGTVVGFSTWMLGMGAVAITSGGLGAIGILWATSTAAGAGVTTYFFQKTDNATEAAHEMTTGGAMIVTGGLLLAGGIGTSVAFFSSTLSTLTGLTGLGLTVGGCMQMAGMCRK